MDRSMSVDQFEATIRFDLKMSSTLFHLANNFAMLSANWNGSLYFGAELILKSGCVNISKQFHLRNVMLIYCHCVHRPNYRQPSGNICWSRMVTMPIIRPAAIISFVFLYILLHQRPSVATIWADVRHIDCCKIIFHSVQHLTRPRVNV